MNLIDAFLTGLAIFAGILGFLAPLIAVALVVALVKKLRRPEGYDDSTETHV